VAGRDFTVSFTVDQPPEVVFAAINDVRGWWSGNIEGTTDQLGSTFTYRYEDVHFSKQTIVNYEPGRRVTWHVDDATLSFTSRPDEWVGTEVTFEVLPAGAATEVRFTHHGLIPDLECHERCSGAWTHFVCDSLKGLITTGAGMSLPGPGGGTGHAS
jgi:uncharacterized protein YndB with AHSA1/START domain